MLENKEIIAKKWFAEGYSKNFETSFRGTDTITFVDTVFKKISWKDDDIVMDVGCGPGDTTKNRLLPKIPRFKIYLAVDVTPSMIEYAKENFAAEKIEYHIADIEDRNSYPAEWQGTITKVVSIHCFQWLKSDQRPAFENIFALMASGGEAVLVFMISAPYWDYYDELDKNEKWAELIKNVKRFVPASHTLKMGAMQYRKMLEEIGFVVLTCEEDKRKFAFEEDAFKNFCGSFSSLTPAIPDDLKEEFREDLYQGNLKLSGRDADGKPLFRYSMLTLHLKKP